MMMTSSWVWAVGRILCSVVPGRSHLLVLGMASRSRHHPMLSSMSSHSHIIAGKEAPMGPVKVNKNRKQMNLMTSLETSLNQRKVRKFSRMILLQPLGRMSRTSRIRRISFLMINPGKTQVYSVETPKKVQVS